MVLLAGPARSWPASSGAKLNTDSSEVHIRSINEKKLREYSLDKEFNYNEDGGTVSPSWWERFWAWVWSWFKDAKSSVSASAGFWKYFFIALGVAAIIFMIVKLTGMDITTLFTGKSKVTEVPYTESLENIHEISFDEEIEKAIENHNFRLAVRLLYLKALKKLSDTGRIKWEPEKTNIAYVNELKHPVQKQLFSLLTYEFEYVWYGSFDVDNRAFEKIRASFTDFYREAYR